MIKKLLLLVMLVAVVSCNQVSDKEVVTPADAIEVLKAGNLRFVNEIQIHPHLSKERVSQTSEKQTPHSAIVGCSDSRVPVECIFDQGVGDIFTIRTAGNCVKDIASVGSVEYAIFHLGVKAVVILGHESCGAVTSAVAKHDSCAHKEPKHVEELIEEIQEYISEYKEHPEQLDEAVHVNARRQVEELLKIEEIKELVDAGKLIVTSAYYNIHTGEVIFDEEN